jgi:hypothetical protein
MLFLLPPPFDMCPSPIVLLDSRGPRLFALADQDRTFFTWDCLFIFVTVVDRNVYRHEYISLKMYARFSY